jgi:transcriptional regulator with XRE-family HTH domain
MSTRTTAPDSGDLGRRVAEHRRRAGLTRQETAARADLAPDYLRYLETSGDPNPSPADITRLAMALGTTTAVLRGAGLDQTPGRQHPDERPRPEPEPLSPAQCWERLAGGGIGRLVFTGERGPVALPVNFAVLGDGVVFRTSARSGLAAAAAQPRVSFEADHLDDVLAEGWSVLVSGQAAVVTTPRELAAVRQLGIAPWAGGDRDCYIRITAREITGRRLRLG